MNLRTFTALAACVLAPAGELRAAAREWNLWPFWVQRSDSADASQVEAAQGVGPVIFYQSTGPGSASVRGVRPAYVEKRNSHDAIDSVHVLYPFFNYRTHASGYRWSMLNLINRTTDRDHTGTVAQRGFDVWPFYFSRQTGDPETSYRAVMPIAGTVKQRFKNDRISWVLFPLYARFEKGDTVTTTTPWPFIKVLQGGGHSGFEFWPLFGRREHPGSYREQFYLWPLVYKNEQVLEDGTASVNLGVLPFYARDERPGYRSETFGWPFFGYVDRTLPYRYHATNYFWPFLVQGHGDDRRVNRWAPVYSHSSIKGTEKTWILWPLWREQSFTDAGLVHERQQFLYFLYNSLEQSSAARPELPSARKVHVWPFYSGWDDGAGRRQVQMLSPFEVFFPHNEVVRHAWSPLFALYRYDRQEDGAVRHSLLWDGVTYHRMPGDEGSEFHLGPIFSSVHSEAGSRISLLHGLIGLKREPGRRWRLFFGDFSPDPLPGGDSTHETN